MRRPPRPPVSRLSSQSASAIASLRRTTTISGTSAIAPKRSRTRARARSHSHSSRLLPQQQRRLSSPSSSRFYSDLASLIESAATESSNITSNSNSSKAPKAMPAQSVPVPWDRLKRWIADQEAAEQQGHTPTNPMTKPQLAALSHIVSFLEGPEPDVTDQDYVSLLMQYFQAKRIQILPTFSDQGLEVPVDGAFVKRWTTTCHLQVAGQALSFPCEGHGVAEGGQPPLFGAKKASKQYAAKHALAYLQSHSSSTVPLPSTSRSISGGGAPLRPVAPPAAKEQITGGSSVSIDSHALTVPSGGAGGGAPLASLPSRVDRIAEIDSVADVQLESVIPDNKAEFYSDKLPSLLEQVASEAKRLNFGCPQYIIGADPNKEGCFAGRPVFQNGGRMPADIGHVAGAISKNAAKELIAEELLEYFKTELDRRQALMGSFAKTKAS